MDVDISSLLPFIDACPTSWHAAEQIAEELSSGGFIRLEEELPWSIKRGGKYFFLREGAVAAFIAPDKGLAECKILISHLDSPALKLKARSEVFREGLALLSVECYGDPILESWLNRDLGLAGKVWVEQRGKLEPFLVQIPSAGFFIPRLATHLLRDQIGERKSALPEILAVSALAPNGQAAAGSPLERLLRRDLNFDQLIAHDLSLYPTASSRLIGIDGEFIAGPRLDNLVSAHACLRALNESAVEEHGLKLAFFFNHEEIGSRTEVGANSWFNHEVLERICIGLQIAEEEKFIAMRHSRALSVDMAHALHPGFAEKFDAQHAPQMGGGIALKQHANRRYASDAQGVAEIVQIAKTCDVPLQYYAVRTGSTCGSTVGPHFAATSGVKTVDLGIAQLSMHSCRELIAKNDYSALEILLKAFLSSR